MPFSIPAAGDYSGYVQQGNAVISNAKGALAGDPGSIQALLQMGVYLAQGSSSKLLQTLASGVSAGVGGFLVGGPAGAAIGIMAAVNDAASAIFNQPKPPPQPIVAIQARLQAWNSAYALSDTSLHPQGWALYDYLSRKYPADAPNNPFDAATNPIPPLPGGHPSQTVCTPYIFGDDPGPGCDTSSGGFAGPPGFDPYGYLISGDAMPSIPGMSPQAVVALAEQNRPPAWSYSADALGFQAGNFGYLPVAGKAFLGLATVLGMLQVGSAPVSIANELMAQHSFYANQNYHEPDDPVFTGLVDFYVGMAHAQQGTSTNPVSPLHLIIGPGPGGLFRDLQQGGTPQGSTSSPHPVVKLALAFGLLAGAAAVAKSGALGAKLKSLLTRR